MQDAIGELFYIIDFLLLGNEEAKIRVVLPQSVQLRRDRGDVELLLQLPTAILEGLIVQENDVGLGKLLPCLLGDANVDVLVQGGVDESYLIVVDDLDEFVPCLGQLVRVALVTLEPDLHSIIILVEFDLGMAQVARLFDFLEEVLAMQPNHLNGVQLYAYLSQFLVGHENNIELLS